MNSVTTWVLWCPPLLPTELLTAVLLSQRNSRLDTLQRLSASTQNISISCLLNKSWTLEIKASISVFSLSCPSQQLHLSCFFSFLIHLTLHQMRPEVPKCNCPSAADCLSLDINSWAAMLSTVLLNLFFGGKKWQAAVSSCERILLFLELELTKTRECCPLLARQSKPKWRDEHTHKPNSCLMVIEKEWSHARRHIFHVSHCVGCAEEGECCENKTSITLFTSIFTTAERLKTQRPHRRKLNPSITDDIIKLLNEITVPVDQRLFSRTGLHNEITLQASAHTGGRPLSQNRAAHKGRPEPLQADFTLYT